MVTCYQITPDRPLPFRIQHCEIAARATAKEACEAWPEGTFTVIAALRDGDRHVRTHKIPSHDLKGVAEWLQTTCNPLKGCVFTVLCDFRDGKPALWSAQLGMPGTANCYTYCNVTPPRWMMPHDCHYVEWRWENG